MLIINKSQSDIVVNGRPLEPKRSRPLLNNHTIELCHGIQYRWLFKQKENVDLNGECFVRCGRLFIFVLNLELACHFIQYRSLFHISVIDADYASWSDPAKKVSETHKRFHFETK